MRTGEDEKGRGMGRVGGFGSKSQCRQALKKRALRKDCKENQVGKGSRERELTAYLADLWKERTGRGGRNTHTLAVRSERKFTNKEGKIGILTLYPYDLKMSLTGKGKAFVLHIPKYGDTKTLKRQS
jgi:hypothetical protein